MPINRKDIQQYSNLELLARQVVEGFITGLHKSPFHGFSVEFSEYRPYNAGESTKYIDWKLYGKTDKLFIKRFEEETNLRCHIVIDQSPSMYFPLDAPESKLSFSVKAAAAIIYMLKKQRDAVGLTLFSDAIDLHTPAKSSTIHHSLLFNNLEQLLDSKPPTSKGTNAAKVIHEIAEIVHKRSLVILFSDMFEQSASNDELFQAIQHLKHNKHEVILFHTIDHLHELEFEYDNRPYRFIDLETGEQIKLQPNEIKDTYRQQIKALVDDIKLQCLQYKIDFVEADITKGYHQILHPYLVKRGKMSR